MASSKAARNSAVDRPDQPDDAAQMSFVDHLEEFRRRLIYAAAGLAIAAVIAALFAQRLLNAVFVPINALLPPGSHFIATRPGEGFSIYLQVVGYTAAIIAAPWTMYQVWLFIAPGLYQREKRLAIPFVLLTSCGCLGGALFNHFIAFRSMMTFFAGFSIATVTLTPSAEGVFDLYLRTLLGMVVIFQMPTIAFFCARMGVVTARFLIVNIKYALLIMFVIAAIATPSSDPWNQTILAGTMMLLYMVCIGIVAAFGRRQPPPLLPGAILLASATLRGRNVVPFPRRR